MTLPVRPPVAPMLAKLARDLPRHAGLFYEPKWDGFRCIVFRDGDDVELGSRNEKPLTRYFPELVDALRSDPSLERYHLLPSVRGDLLAKLGRPAEARAEFERAAGLTQNSRERAVLLRRAAACVTVPRTVAGP